MIKSLLKDSLIYTIPTLFTRGITFFLLPLYTRVLSPTDYGSLDLFIIFASIIKLTVALEITQAVARYFPAEKDDFIKNKIATTSFLFSIACYTLFLIVSLLFSSELSELIMGQSNMQTPFIIGVVYIWTNGLLYVLLSQFKWDFKSKHYTIVSSITALVTAIFSVYLAYFLKYGLNGLLIGMLSGSIVGLIISVFNLRHRISAKFDILILKKLLTFSAPLVLSSAAVWVGLYVDRLMINHFLTLNEVGQYGIGHRASSIVTLLMVGFQGALTPLVYANFEKPDTPEKIAQIFKYFVIVASFVTMIFVLFSKELIMILATVEYIESSTLIKYLVPSIILSSMYLFAPGTSIANKTQLILYINLIGGSINILLNYVLIQYFGMQGAAVATLTSNTIIFGIYVYLGQKYYFINYTWGVYFQVLFVTIVIIVGFTYVSALTIYTWCTFMVAIILYIVIIAKSNILSVREKDQLKHYIRRHTLRKLEQ